MSEQAPKPSQTPPDLSRFLPELSDLIGIDGVLQSKTEAPESSEPRQLSFDESLQEDLGILSAIQASTEVLTKRRVRGRDKPIQPQEAKLGTDVSEEEWQEFEVFTRQRNQKGEHRDDKSRSISLKDKTKTNTKAPDYRIGEKAWVEAERFKDGQKRDEEKTLEAWDRFNTQRDVLRKMIEEHATPSSDDAQDNVQSTNHGARAVVKTEAGLKPGGPFSFTTEEWLNRHNVPDELIKLAIRSSVVNENADSRLKSQPDPAILSVISRQITRGSTKDIQREEPKNLPEEAPKKRQSRLAKSHGAIARVIHRRFGFKMKPWGLEK